MAVAHVVGGLSLDEGRVFRSHLLECTACRARVGELRAIAHDLADVERDERRERAAQRTELKERERDEAELPPPPSRRLNGRATVLIALALVALMALSAWNFVLRGQLQQQDNLAVRLRGSVQILREGIRWNVLPATGRDRVAASVVEGHVTTLDNDLLVLVSGLTAGGTYRLSLLDAELREISFETIEATQGTLLAYRTELSELAQVDQITLKRIGPNESPTVFAAERGEALEPESDEASDAVVEPVGDAAG